jgi:hypothetical protein
MPHTHPDFKTDIQEKSNRQWKLETLTGVVGYRMLDAHRKRTEKNLDAEEAAVRQKLWGESPGKKDETTGEDMGDQIVLGDLTHPTPIIVNQPSTGLGKVLAGSALAAGMLGIPGAGIAGYLLSQMQQKDKPVDVLPFTYETLDVGLSRIGDLVKP